MDVDKWSAEGMSVMVVGSVVVVVVVVEETLGDFITLTFGDLMQ